MEQTVQSPMRSLGTVNSPKRFAWCQDPYAVPHGISFGKHGAHVIDPGGQQSWLHDRCVDDHQSRPRGQVERHAVGHLVDAS